MIVAVAVLTGQTLAADGRARLVFWRIIIHCETAHWPSAACVHSQARISAYNHQSDRALLIPAALLHPQKQIERLWSGRPSRSKYTA
eukprot:scaffold166705_cov19-Prasinocladus_malaysianus.AAC.1